MGCIVMLLIMTCWTLFPPGCKVIKPASTKSKFSWIFLIWFQKQWAAERIVVSSRIVPPQTWPGIPAIWQNYKKSQSRLFFNFFLTKVSYFVSNLNDDFHKASFEVYYVSVSQTLVILGFSPQIFFILTSVTSDTSWG